MNKVLTLLFIAILFVIAFLVLKSIILSIIIGLLLAYIFNPIYKYIHKKISNGDLSTIILIIILILIVAIPLWFIIPALTKQIFETYMLIQQSDITGFLQNLLPSIFTEEFAASFGLSFSNFSTQFFNSLLTELGKFLVNIPSLLLQLAVILFTFYFATRDSEKLKKYVYSLSPFSGATEKRFLQEFRNITNTIIYGQFLIAVIQGIALGIGMFALGVPKVLILTAIAIVVSFIPILGSWLVWLPVGVVLIVSGNPVSGIILLLYGAIFVSSIDNVLRPILLSKKTTLPTSIALIGIIGGIYAFGLIGLILGPLILAYVLIIIDFYRQGKLGELFKN